jgi:hypothetical protein
MKEVDTRVEQLLTSNADSACHW